MSFHSNSWIFALTIAQSPVGLRQCTGEYGYTPFLIERHMDIRLGPFLVQACYCRYTFALLSEPPPSECDSGPAISRFWQKWSIRPFYLRVTLYIPRLR